MSYKVLARKWRPQHFQDMLGQEPVLRALVNALDTNRLHHAYLFTGMRGVGKTTIARIFAKCLNCETKGVTSDPCGTCSACVDIDAGRFFDLIEVDAASRTKVEGTRELLENVPYAPASGRYKVYLIDEVHMFSTHSFNALLKTLEEPPEHVKFLLATTDPQKVPATVLSRCLQFNLKRMPVSHLTRYLSGILKEEKIEHELPALDLIARASEGSVRDSLSLVEQAAATGEGAIRASEVESMLGRASIERLLQLLSSLAAGDMQALFTQVEELAQYAPDFAELLGELLTLLHRIAMLATVPGSVSEEVPGYERLAELAKKLEPDTVQLFYQIGLHARRDMPFAPDAREAFDMALLRMNAFRPQGGHMGGDRGGGHIGSGDVVSSQGGSAGLGAQAPDSTMSGANPAGTDTGAGTGRSTAPAHESAAAPSPAAASVAAANAPPDSAAGTASAASAPNAETRATQPGLAVRGSVSAGSSMRAAALAAARGDPLPDDIAQEIAHINAGKGLQNGTAKAPESAELDNTQAAQSANADSVQTSQPCKASQSVEAPGFTAQPQSNEQQSKQAPEEPETESINKHAVEGADWARLVSELDVGGMPLQLANNCTLAAIDGDLVQLQLAKASEHLHKPQFEDRLLTALSAWFGRAMKVRVEVVDSTQETPAKLAEKHAAEQLAAAHDSIRLDPIVKQLIERVDAAVDESSIRPMDSDSM